MTAPAARVRGKYATRVGEKPNAPSVTTISGMLEKGGLPWGAAKETALFAIYHQNEWINEAPDVAYERLRKHHKGVWDDKANRGTMVHDFALSWSQGRDVECPPDCAPYLDALEAFYADKRPKWRACEQTVIYQSPNGDLDYAGTPDGFALVDDIETEIDYKTGGRYPIETAIQMALYRYATGLGVYDAFGTLVDIAPMPKVERTCVLYLHENGSYEFLDIPADEKAFATGMHLRATWNWLKEMERWEKAHPEITTQSKREVA